MEQVYKLRKNEINYNLGHILELFNILVVSIHHK